MNPRTPARTARPVLAVIPARAGSKGLPGKNIRSLAGLPLIAHSIRLAALSPEIDKCIVSTDGEEIAAVARAHGAQVPFLRPAELATDLAPTWAVLQHAVTECEQQFQKRFESVLLLQPTNPCRLPEDVTRAVELLEDDPEAVGVIAVSEPHFNPRWVCVEESEGYMKQLIPASQAYVRRQDVPPVYRINGLLYLWRRDHAVHSAEPGYYSLPHRMLVVPELRAGDVDTAEDLAMLECVLGEGLVKLPWLTTLENEGMTREGASA
jgi:CMP-N,N'-diacetyllegionaminic acid synthase